MNNIAFVYELMSVIIGVLFPAQVNHVFTGEGFLFLSTNILNERITINMIVIELVLILMTLPLI